MNFVDLAIRNARLTLAVLLFLIVAGTMSYISIPKEAEPDIKIPIIYVSPAAIRAFRQRIRSGSCSGPMETKLKNITGIKEMRSTAYQGGGNVVIEFMAGADLSKALDDVRNKVSDAKPDLPQGRRRADGQRGQYLRISGSGGDAFRRCARAGC
jgi:multidrug efflux pump